MSTSIKCQISGYTVVPNAIKVDNEISLLSRFILSDILAFDESNQCYASNQYFATVYQVSVRRIEQCLQELHNKGYVYSIYNRKKQERTIWPTHTYMEKIKAQQYKVIVREIENPDTHIHGQYTNIKDLHKIWTE